MPNLSPPARAAAVFLVLLIVVGVAATGLLLAEGWKAAERDAQHELQSTATALATALDLPDGWPRPGTAERLARLTADRGLAAIAVLDAQGRLLAASAPEALRQIDWPGLLSSGALEDAVPRIAWLGDPYYIASAAHHDGAHVAVLRAHSDVNEASKPLARGLALIAILAGLVVIAGLGGLVLYSGRRTTGQLQTLSERLAALDPAVSRDEGERLLEQAQGALGPMADALQPVAEALAHASARSLEAQSHIAALLQINPHYVLLCTLDGHIVDANPAFYAMTGLPFEAVRGNRIEVLNEVLPVEPLFDLVRRSFREGSSISGVDYALINRDDVRRPVQISLRGVMIGGREGAIIQATDVANQRNLERQISAFSDALDLMVDQRVAQLTAGNAAIEQLLDEGGVVLASFDRGGSTRRWNRAAEALTGRTVAMVPHFSAFVSVIGLPAVARQAFSDWFWGASKGSFAQDVFDADGQVRRMLWRRSVTGKEGQAERCMLFGMDLPRPAATMPPAGDSGEGAVPNLGVPVSP